MIPRRIRQVLCNLKENTSVSFAHIATMGGFCSLDLLLIKATSPDDFPLNDKYVHDLLKIFSIAPATSSRAFTSCFVKRFMKTRCWRVALKSLLLLHRLLRSLPVNSHLRAEMLRARVNGSISLNLCSFQDVSSRAGDDYSVFVRSYAYLLDEAIGCFAIDLSNGEENTLESLILDETKQAGRLIQVLPQLQSLIDRVMDCRPKGAAAKNFLVQVTMKHIIRDSFICYRSFRKDIVVVLDNLIQLPYNDSIEAFGIYKKASNQAIHLSEFYDWSKPMGFCGSYEYPYVDQIPEIQIRALSAFLQGMRQFAESSEPHSSSSSSSSSSMSITAIEEVMVEKKEEEMGLMVKEHKEMEPLIKFEDEYDEVSWEVLLEASLLPPPRIVSGNNGLYFNNFYGYEPQYYGNNNANLFANQVNQWQIQVLSRQGNPFGSNHFYQTYNIPFYHGPFPYQHIH